MSVNYAQTQRNQAYLNTRFGLELAHARLGLNNDIIEAFVGRYSRGKRKGQLRGAIAWEKVVRGGWSSKGYGYGGVKYPGTISNVRLSDAWTGEVIYEQKGTLERTK